MSRITLLNTLRFSGIAWPECVPASGAVGLRSIECSALCDDGVIIAILIVVCAHVVAIHEWLETMAECHYHGAALLKQGVAVIFLSRQFFCRVA